MAAASVLTGAAFSATAVPPSSGTFSVSYVAGMPEGLSSGSPKANTPIIGQRIRPYDVVHVQEDFNYHASLYANNTHHVRTPTSGGVPFGDGLNTLADYPYTDFARKKWDRCDGADCLTPKGFTWSRLRIAEGVVIDFDNLRTNAGDREADLAARRADISRLSRFITDHSAGNAVVVAGDMNTRYTRTSDNIRELVSANALTDAWVREEQGGLPPAAGSPPIGCNDHDVSDACEVVDKILFRGNRYITLDLTRYANENTAFRTANNKMLSDHAFTDLATVAPAQRVSGVSLRAGSRLDQVGRTRVFFARFTTNTGRTLSGGSETLNAVTHTAPAGWQIAGFHGRSGNEADSLGVVYTKGS